MQTAKAGDRVHVHYVKRFQDGSVTSSHKREPVELTVGVDHQSLPGLGLALVGLSPGTKTKISVPAALAYGLPNPDRVHHLSRTRFPKEESLAVGKWIRVLNRQGRPRTVRILEVRDKTVIVDTNHRWAGQAMELEVELIGIERTENGRELR